MSWYISWYSSWTFPFSTGYNLMRTSCFIYCRSLLANPFSMRYIFRSTSCSISWYFTLNILFIIRWIFRSTSCFISWLSLSTHLFRMSYIIRITSCSISWYYQSPKGQDYLHFPLTSLWLRIYSRFNTRTPCWLENATWLNFLSKIFPILPDNPVFWEINLKGKRNENNKVMSWSRVKAMSWSRGGTEGF